VPREEEAGGARLSKERGGGGEAPEEGAPAGGIRAGRMHLCSGTIRAPQAEEKLSAGFEFEKQMKKFNDVELRRRALPTAARAEWILPG